MNPDSIAFWKFVFRISTAQAIWPACDSASRTDIEKGIDHLPVGWKWRFWLKTVPLFGRLLRDREKRPVVDRLKAASEWA